MLVEKDDYQILYQLEYILTLFCQQRLSYSLGEILSRVAAYFIRRETTKVQHDFMNRKMTMKDLEEMDTNGDGEVDLFEFISFMLSKMQMVDVELMNELKDLFESLDETRSNSIQKEDLLLIAQIRDWRGKED